MPHHVSIDGAILLIKNRIRVVCIMKKSAFVMKEMIQYFEGDIKRINHLIKVFGFAKTLGELERIDSYTQEIIEIAALTHDIGIKKSEEKYNSSSGHYQQIEGPNEARMLLRHIEIEDELIERVCWLIAHHHTYIGIDAVDYQILIEADFLVNAWEENMEKSVIFSTKEKIFRTKSGKSMIDSIYKLEQL